MIIYEKNTLKIYYYKNLLRIDQNEVVIYLKKSILKVNGINLKINYYEKDELHICGVINNIHFDYV